MEAEVGRNHLQSRAKRHPRGGASIKKVTQISIDRHFFLTADGSGEFGVFRVFFYRGFELPLLRNSQKNAIKKIEQNNRGRKKTEGKKGPFFEMGPDGLCFGGFF
jgi:hypothetical protein